MHRYLMGILQAIVFLPSYHTLTGNLGYVWQNAMHSLMGTEHYVVHIDYRLTSVNGQL